MVELEEKGGFMNIEFGDIKIEEIHRWKQEIDPNLYSFCKDCHVVQECIHSGNNSCLLSFTEKKV